MSILLKESILCQNEKMLKKCIQVLALQSYTNFLNLIVQPLSHVRLFVTPWTAGFCVLHYFLEFAQTYIHWVSYVIQPSHPLSPPSPPALNLSQLKPLWASVSKFVKCWHYLLNLLDNIVLRVRWDHVLENFVHYVPTCTWRLPLSSCWWSSRPGGAYLGISPSCSHHLTFR